MKELVYTLLCDGTSEAWLLFDETAIRNAADNPNGKRVLRKRFESLKATPF